MPLTVYADILVIVNLYIDFFLLWCVKKTLHLPVKNRRLALGALAGAALSLAVLIPALPGWASLLLGLFTACAVTAAAFAPAKPKTLCRAAVCFWSFSFLLAGFFLFLLRFFAPKNVAVLGNVVYLDLSLPLLFLFTCGAYLLFTLARKLLPGGSPDLRYCRITVENKGQILQLYAKADTGNGLREPFSGLPVIVCQAEKLGGTAPPEVLAFLSAGDLSETGGTKNPPPSGNLRLVPFESMGGAGVLPAFRPEKVTVEKTGQTLSCYIAACRRSLSAGQFDALYNPDLFPEQK